MLSRRPSHAAATSHQAVDLSVASFDAPLIEEILHVSVGGPLRQATDGACPVHLVAAEELFGKLVRLGLILPGEVEVDIGHFVAVEAEKGLKGNIVTVPIERRLAIRTSFLGQVDACGDASVVEDLKVMAFGADVVRRQGIDLGDPAHRGDERGAH